MKSAEQACDKCKSPLQFGAGGLCAACLLEAGLTSAEEAGFKNELTCAALEDAWLTRRMGDFELIEEIGRGGTGVIYSARQVSLDRIVAVKVLLAGEFADRTARQRLFSEARIASQLSHPNIVTIHEISEEQGHPFFSMEFVAGRNLAQITRDGLLPLPLAAQYVEKIARAVHFAHERGVVHRDLKPANVLVSIEGEPKLTDFGLHKSSNSETQTVEGSGSPNFMAPEQANSRFGKTGTLTDVFGLGGILYFLLTGRPPTLGETLGDTLRSAVDGDVVPVRTLRPGAPRDLETIALKCLEKEQSRRYQSALEVAEELGRFGCGEPILARPVGPLERGVKWVRRRPAISALVAALAITLTTGIAGIVWQLREAKARESAQRSDAYIADLALASSTYEQNPHSTHEILDRWRTRTPPREGLGWEWRHLWFATLQAPPVFETDLGRPVHSIAVSDDDRFAAIGTERGGVEILETSTWRVAFRGATNVNLEIAPFGPAGNKTGSRVVWLSGLRQFAWSETRGSSNCVLQFWNSEARKIVRTLEQPYIVAEMTANTDGSKLFVRYQTPHGGTTVWDVSAGRALLSVAHEGIMANFSLAQTLAVSPDGRLFTRAIFPAQLGILETATGREVRRFDLPDEYLLSAAFSPDGKLLAAGAGFAAARQIDVWDVETGELKKSLKAPEENGNPRWLGFTADGRTLLELIGSGVLLSWELSGENRQSRRDLGGNSSIVFALPRGKSQVFANVGHNRFCVVNLSGDRHGPARLELPVALNRDWNFVPTGDRIVGVATNGTPVVVTGPNWDHVEEFTPCGTNSLSISISQDFSQYIICEKGGGLTLRDRKSHSIIRRFEQIPTPPSWSVFASKNDLVYTGADLGPNLAWVGAWKISTGERIFTNHFTVRQCYNQVTPDGKAAIVLDYSGQLRRFDLDTGEMKERQLPFLGAVAFGLSPDARYLVTAAPDYDGRRVDLASESMPETISSARSFNAKYNPTGDRIFYLGSGGATLNIWDSRTLRKVGSAAGNAEIVNEVQFSGDGRYVAAAGALSRRITVWIAPTLDEIKKLAP